MTEIVVEPRADEQMREIIANLEAERGIAFAATFALKFADQIDFIRQYPRASEARPRWGRHVRRTLVEPYVMIYSYDPATDVATVLRVLHGRRKLTKKLVQR